MTKVNPAVAINKSHAEVVTTPAPANGQIHSPRRILIVEDDTDIRRLYCRVLISSGYRVDTAEDGEAGWKVLHGARHDPDSYHLLITDNNMPKLTGVELIKKVRAARMTLPVILASGGAHTEPEWLHLAESLQLAAILPKPFTLDHLVQTVRQVLHAAHNLFS